MFNGQHAQVLAICRHFKTQHTEKLLIEFKDMSLPPTIKIYQVSWADNYRTELLLPSIWKEKGKGRAKEKLQSSLLGYVTLDQRNLFYQPPRLICVDCGKKLSTMDPTTPWMISSQMTPMHFKTDIKNWFQLKKSKNSG
ncbi:hypothetical protein G9A89_013683 [Geosiphon pyriformis]|nr:hypothetical protein G9A89_013683 [Geosiphon pyriformis]